MRWPWALVAGVRAYSVDLRQRVLALVDAAELPRAAIAELLRVSRRWMDKMISQRRRLGHVAPLGHAGGAKLKLDAAGREELRAAWAARPDASLAELAAALAARGGPNVSVATVHRAVQAMDLTRKKRRTGPREPTSRNARTSVTSSPRCPIGALSSWTKRAST